MPRIQEISYEDTFPTMLRKLMQKRGTTQSELATVCGSKPQTISLYANGQSLPSSATLLKIAQFYDVSVDYLLTGVSSQNTDISRDLGLSEESIKFIRKVNDRTANPDLYSGLMSPIGALNLLLSNEAFYNFLNNVLEDVVFIRSYQAETDGKDLDDTEKIDFHIWKLQEYVRKFIYAQLHELGVPIE